MSIPRDLIDGYLRYATGETLDAAVCASCGKTIAAGARITFYVEGPRGSFCCRACRHQAVTPDAVETAIRGRIARSEARIREEHALVVLYERDLARVRVPELFPVATLGESA